MKDNPDFTKYEVKHSPGIIKSVSEETRTAVQVFSVFNVLDAYRDRIIKGSFKKTIKERKDKFRVLWQHDFFAPPIGLPLEVYEIDADALPDAVREKYPEADGGLEAVVEYLQTPRGDEVFVGIVKKAIRENSIGFDPIKIKMTEISVPGAKDIISVRDILEIRLWDLSPVNWGANEATFNRRALEMASVISHALDEGVTSEEDLIELRNAVNVLDLALKRAEPEPVAKPPDFTLTLARAKSLQAYIASL